MPLTRRQFDLGVDTETEAWMNLIREFLDAHEDLAYTEEELAKHFERPAKDATERRRLQVALVKLMDTGAIDHRKVGTEVYYASSHIKQTSNKL